ncbi:MAG TPA: DUF2321 domain-containing protein [Candidatus Angelobacter sp.]|nr:DUF2321 domain-containing protein [Candidatus Angelobacter sp.]
MQIVARVYPDGGEEFRVSAPEKATGDVLDWLPQLKVRTNSKEPFGGEEIITDGRSGFFITCVEEKLRQQKLDADIWRSGTNPDGRYVAAQICLRGHILKADGMDFERGEHCPQCGEVGIDSCKHCKAAIRGGEVSAHPDNYKRPNFCHKCGRAYPWMEDRLKTAKELLNHDDKLSYDERENLWGLLQYVMSDPKSDLVPANKKLIEISLANAATVTRDLVTDFMAKYFAEMSKS